MAVMTMMAKLMMAMMSRRFTLMQLAGGGVAGGFWGYSENEAARDIILIVSLTFLKFVKTKFNLT